MGFYCNGTRFHLHAPPLTGLWDIIVYLQMCLNVVIYVWSIFSLSYKTGGQAESVKMSVIFTCKVCKNLDHSKRFSQCQ